SQRRTRDLGGSRSAIGLGFRGGVSRRRDLHVRHLIGLSDLDCRWQALGSDARRSHYGYPHEHRPREQTCICRQRLNVFHLAVLSVRLWLVMRHGLNETWWSQDLMAVAVA